MNKLSIREESECSCEICKGMCQRPCWGTPEDIKKIIDAGFGDRLMADFWEGSKETNDEDVEILCGALKGHEAMLAPFFPISKEGCSFFKNGLCELHDLKLKPIEGRLATCKDVPEEKWESIHKNVMKTWNTEEGRDLVKKWKEKHNLSKREDSLLDMLDFMAKEFSRKYPL